MYNVPHKFELSNLSSQNPEVLVCLLIGLLTQCPTTIPSDGLLGSPD